MKKGIMQRDAMLAPSASLAQLREYEDRLGDDEKEEPFQNLANAIVCVAADDYRTALANGDEPLLSNLRNFFRSAWYRVLTNVDPELLMNALNEEYQEHLAATSA